MAKEYAKQFYNSSAWIKTSKAYAASKFFLCEKCGKPYKIVHHVQHITPENIGDAEITLSWKNLCCMCQDCHAAAHASNNNRTMRWDSDGNLIGCDDEHPSL